MADAHSVTVESWRPSLGSLVVLAAIFVAGLFLVGFDQGHLFSLVQGEVAFDQSLLHELTHDMRHVTGFPCH
ncbi:MAG: CbtB-domain containing protein [Nitrosopumilaceae archaeon]|nr:CbtB-domain containing protein [Nitrosopumilaceae archaeon]